MRSSGTAPLESGVHRQPDDWSEPVTSNHANNNARAQPDEQLTITRVFHAPQHEIFSAWTDRRRAKRWWGPKGFDTPVLEMDLRPRGEWYATMFSPEGKSYPQRGVFREIRPPQRLAFTLKWVNQSDPESLVTVELDERDGRTEMTFRQNFFKSREARESHREGWNESFDRLADEVAQTTPEQSPAQPGKPGPEHRKLDVFVGRWNGVGESKPDGPLQGKMTVADTYEWLPGGYFLIDRGQLQVAGNEPVAHVWVFGYDDAQGTYVIRAFDGEGHFREYRASVHERVWTFTGQSERARIEFSPDGLRFTAHWDIAKDGSTWAPLCDVTMTRCRSS